MRLPFVALAVLIAAPALAFDRPPPAEPCPNAKLHQADRDRPVRARPLDQEPNARQEIAVLYTAGGCVRPIVVRDNVGGSYPAR